MHADYRIQVLWPLVVIVMLAVTPATQAITLHTTDFISDGQRMHFNSFEALPVTNGAVPPNGVSAVYVEDNIRVEQVPRQDGWITSTWWWSGSVSNPCPPDGNRSWYPSGGDHGYTRITLQDGSNFQDVGFFRSSGQPEYSSPGNGVLLYELLCDGNLVTSGIVSQGHDAPRYLGFSGGGFDEIRVRDGMVGIVTTFYDGTSNALAIDAIETAVPEPTMVLMLSLGGMIVFRRHCCS